MKKLKILKLDSVPIFKQLQIEEALLRADEENYCLINTNSPQAIVMGISGKIEKLVNVDLTKKDGVPIIKRFSGGGTVYIDPETVFVTFIGKDFDFPPYPQDILKWSEIFYRPLFPSLNFQLRENDYVIGEKKIGGNAQYIRNKRWLLHTSFLWNFSKEKMEYLLHPEKKPEYRKERSHAEFLSSLSNHFSCKKTWINDLKNHLHATFETNDIDLSEIQPILSQPYRQATTFIY